MTDAIPDAPSMPRDGAYPRVRLRAYQAPGLFITGTNTDVGKTTVTAALAGAFHRLHLRVGICKPIASGCPKFADRGNSSAVPLVDDDFQSPDAAISARAAGLDPTDRSLLRYLSPLRYAAPVAPAIAAAIERRPPDWRRVEAALDWWQENAEVLVVEGAGGWYVPLDPPPHDFMVADMAAALRLPVLVVATAGIGAINHALLTIHAIRERNLPVVGLVLNRVAAEGKRDIVTEFNVTELPRLSGVPVRAILPDVGESMSAENVHEPLVDAMLPFAREWWGLVQPQ